LALVMATYMLSHSLHRGEVVWGVVVYLNLDRYTRFTVLYLIVPTAIVTLSAIVLVLYAWVYKSNLADSLLTILSAIIVLMSICVGVSQVFLSRRSKDN
jgi:hypothetical protein